jgi:hypothetical protein
MLGEGYGLLLSFQMPGSIGIRAKGEHMELEEITTLYKNLRLKALLAVERLEKEAVRANDRAAFLGKHLSEKHDCKCEGISLIGFIQYMEEERRKTRPIDAAHVAVNAIVSCAHLEAGACEECIRLAIESRGTLK